MFLKQKQSKLFLAANFLAKTFLWQLFKQSELILRITLLSYLYYSGREYGICFQSIVSIHIFKNPKLPRGRTQ